MVGGPKNALVPHPDGSHRRMYCQESPEPWFEDFGEATLSNGRATVRLDPDFDAVVKGDNYQVFLTEYADFGGLFVADRRPHAFEVRARAAQANGSFGYRVVSRRKDIAGPRLERVELPPRPRDIRPLPALPDMSSALPGTRPAQPARPETRTDVDGGPPVFTPR